MNDQGPLTENELIYQAIGLMEGKLDQLEDGSYQLECCDLTFAVTVRKVKLLAWLEAHPEVREGMWSVYPQQEEGELQLELVSFMRKPWGEVNYFKICGRVVWQDDEGGRISVGIRRNYVPKGQDPRFGSFKLELLGHLPGKIGGEFWQFDCVRSGHQLEIVGGTRLAKRLNRKPKPTIQAEQTGSPL